MDEKNHRNIDAHHETERLDPREPEKRLHLMWFADHNRKLDAYVIHSELKRNLVWTFNPKAKNGMKFYLDVYRYGDRRQLWRKSDTNISNSSFFIFNIDETVTEAYMMDIWNSKFNVLSLDQCNFDITFEGWGGNKNTLWSFDFPIDPGYPTVCIPKTGDPECPDPHIPIYPVFRNIVQIHNKVGNDKKMIIWNTAPTEEKTLLAVPYDHKVSPKKAGMESWWWTEKIDKYFVIHSFSDPDMVWSLFREKLVRTENNGKKSLMKVKYHLKLEKFIPGDQRQLFYYVSSHGFINAKLEHTDGSTISLFTSKGHGTFIKKSYKSNKFKWN